MAEPVVSSPRQPRRRWESRRSIGSAADFHARPFDGGGGRRVVHVLDVDRPALVLGSTQPAAVVDAGACAAAGVEVVRRRSGGGVVLLDPGAAVWVDVELPAGDPLADDDVGRAAWWVGEAWAAALGALGVRDLAVHRGGMERRDAGRLVCFAGVGPGEVLTAGGDGRKVVGISQRRTRAGARFQCAVPLAWDGERLAGLLADPAAAAAARAARVAPVAASGDAVVDAFLPALPA